MSKFKFINMVTEYFYSLWNRKTSFNITEQHGANYSVHCSLYTHSLYTLYSIHFNLFSALTRHCNHLFHLQISFISVPAKLFTIVELWTQPEWTGLGHLFIRGYKLHMGSAEKWRFGNQFLKLTPFSKCKSTHSGCKLAPSRSMFLISFKYQYLYRSI